MLGNRSATLRNSASWDDLECWQTGLWATCGSMSGFVNKNFLEHSYANLISYPLWLLSCYNNGVE